MENQIPKEINLKLPNQKKLEIQDNKIPKRAN